MLYDCRPHGVEGLDAIVSKQIQTLADYIRTHDVIEHVLRTSRPGADLPKLDAALEYITTYADTNAAMFMNGFYRDAIYVVVTSTVSCIDASTPTHCGSDVLDYTLAMLEFLKLYAVATDVTHVDQSAAKESVLVAQQTMRALGTIVDNRTAKEHNVARAARWVADAEVTLQMHLLESPNPGLRRFFETDLANALEYSARMNTSS